MRKINIAIDGPSAAGKSTISKLVAKELGYIHLDTGAMYRSCAYKAKVKGISWEDEEALAEMLLNTKIELKGNNIVFVDGNDVSKEIRENDISMGASNVSKLLKVRELLVKEQQHMAENKGFVMDGRDIGSVVLKDAELKIYQTASVETRAQRRYLENQEKGISCTLEEIQEDIRKRDYQDTHRENSPLIKVDDAIELDTSDLTIQEAVDFIIKLAKEKINA